MKTIVNGLTVTIDEVVGVFTASASFGADKIIQLSATSSRDYAAVAALFDALKKQAIENMKEMTDRQALIAFARIKEATK